MSLKKQIKTLTLIFVILLLSFTTAAVLFFQKNFSRFDEMALDHSKAHVETLKRLAEIESGLYVYYDQLPCALTTHEDQCRKLIDSGRKLIFDGFVALEKINAKEISKWVALANFQSTKPRKELRELLTNLHTDNFQHLYDLVHLNAKQYVQNADKLLEETKKQSLTNQPQPASLAAEDEHLEEIYLGLYAIKDGYNRIFWENSHTQSQKLARSNRNYLFAMLAGSALLVGFTILIALSIGRYFRLQRQKDEALAALGARDLVTGLFNHRSMEVLLGQELQRAKRHNYSLSLLMLRVEPYDNIKNQVGQAASDRLFFQIAEVLKSECRAYDSLFKTDKNSFFIAFPEADPKIINSLIARIRKKFGKKRFLVKSDQTKIQPTILLGAAGYPINGSDFNELVTFAEQTLSENFDAKVIHELPDGVVDLPANEPEETAPEQEQEAEPVVASSEKQNPTTDEIAPQGASAEVTSQQPAEETPPPVDDKSPEEIPNNNVTFSPPITEAAPVKTPLTSVTIAPLPSASSPTVHSPAISSEDNIPDIVSALLPPEETPHVPQAPAKILSIPTDEFHIDLSNAAKAPAPIATNKEAILVDLDQERQKLAEKFRRKKSTP